MTGQESNTGLANLTDTYFNNRFNSATKAPVKSTNSANLTNSALDNSVFGKNYSAGFESGLASRGTDTGWFGKGGYLNTGAQAFNAASAALEAYTGLKALGLAEDKFDMEKAYAAANLANQADLVNQERMNAAKVGLALAGNTLTPEQRSNKLSEVTAGNVQRTV